MIYTVKRQMRCTVRFLQNEYEMEKIYSEGMESGEKRGELKKAKETALSMAEEGMDVKMIARLVKVSEKDVQKWIDETLCVTK